MNPDKYKIYNKILETIKEYYKIDNEMHAYFIFHYYKSKTEFKINPSKNLGFLALGGGYEQFTDINRSLDWMVPYPYQIIDVFVQNGKLYSSFIEIDRRETKTQEIYVPEHEEILKQSGAYLKKDTKYEWYKEYLDYKESLCQYKIQEQINELLVATKTLH